MVAVVASAERGRCFPLQERHQPRCACFAWARRAPDVSATLSVAPWVLSREQLAALAGGRQIDAQDRAIDLQISRLRQKLGDDARGAGLIKTVRNGGYVLAAPTELD